MLGVKATTQKAASFQWTEAKVEELVQNSTLPDHWTSGSIITYQLVNLCIAIIKRKKMVMKHHLPEVCQLLETSRCEGQSSEATKKAPLTPNQVGSFVQKVENRMREGKKQYEAVVEFPKSASKGGKKTDSRKTAEVAQSSASPLSVSDVTLSDKVKSDIEEVVEESFANLVELHTLIKKLEEAERKHRWGNIDNEAYKGLVEEFKSAHQKNIMDKRGTDAKLGVIELCNPFEDENNKALEELIQEKHKELVRAYYDEVLYAKVILCGGLDWQKEEDVRAREEKAMALVSEVLEIDYKGEPDPVDFATSLKSILEYVVGVVPKHLGKEPAEEEDDEDRAAAGSSSGRPRRRQGLVGSQEWENSWEKHFEDAAEESKSLAEQQRELQLERERADLLRKLQAEREKKRQLQAELEKQKCLQQLMSEIGDLERRRDQILADALAEVDSDSDTEEAPRKRRRSSRSGKKSQKKK